MHDINPAINVIESSRKAADFYTPARLLIESLYGGKWRSIKAKLAKVTELEKDEYYMTGVRELMNRVARLNVVS